MLLTEILKKPIKGLRTSNKPVTDLLHHKHNVAIGVGAQTIAYLHKKFPGKVIKTVQVRGTDDPTYQYLRLCLNHQNNPYFPKIYSVKMYPTKDVLYKQRTSDFERLNTDFEPGGFDDFAPTQSNYTLYVVTEKLQRMGNFTKRDLDRLGIQVPELPPDKAKYATRMTPETKFQYQFRVMFMSPRGRMQLRHMVNDPKMKEALRLMEPLFRHYDEDMHSNNVMIRPPNQWVFTDPITYTEEDE